ncbi:SpoIIE family protein phosphatase [Limibaculum sp. FT325]|uniref:PP2C family protein-serine/threonine phosphatase n=1 Tax=Thermohalobaculum sediminis TaxID=2939436 RepID=UPI0020C09B00|nr:SpoIIE family protein phosphatase [Limibaculum sediminis]MCL5775672.1 SpoIIE family protein phosphatase [Limibaculum sediminis]
MRPEIAERSRGGHAGEPEPEGAGRLLLVDDSATQRILLASRLRRWGYDVTEAADGAEALARIEREGFRLVLSDWVMPGLSGPELCRAIRRRETDQHAYVILLTSRQEKSDVSEGLGAGADDFLSKPVDEGELAARLTAGRRVLALQERLIGQREEMTRAYRALRALHDRLDRDLAVAAGLQRAVLPPAFAQVAGFRVGALCRPQGHVGGDHVGYFAAGEGTLGAYSIDVSGHGVASALLAIRLAQHFDPGSPDGNLAFEHAPGEAPRLRPPAEVMAELNERFLSGRRHDLYFTMAYAVAEHGSGWVRMCQAGHPAAAVVAPDGRVRFAGDGGPPVGLLPGMTFTETRLRLAPGDRLVLHSDGITEARAADGSLLETDGLAHLLGAGAALPAEAVLPDLLARLEARGGPEGFEDDLSAVLIERPAG